MKLRFKRITALLLVLAMTLSLMSVTAFAADTPAYAHLEIGTAVGAPGDTVKVPVYLKGIKEGQKCRGFDTTVVLGENLTAAGVEWTDLVKGFGYQIYNKDSGYLTATDIMNSGFRITEDGKVCDLLVKIADDATSVGAVSLTKVSVSGDTAVDFLNSTDGTMATRDLNAVVTPVDAEGKPVPVISIKTAASFTMKVEADKSSVTAGEDVTVTVKVEGGSFVGAAAKLAYDSSKFEIKTADASTGWSTATSGNGYVYYNVAEGQKATLGTFVFTAKAQTEEVTGSFTLSDTYCEEEWENGAEKKPSTPCANNGKVDVTIALKDDLGVTAENKTVTYDGNEQAFNNVTCSVEGATIAYGETEGTYDLTTVPSKTDAGTYTLYYKVTALGYAPKTGSYTLTINPADIEYTATGFDGTYDGANRTITVTVTKPANAVITYSEEENGTYTETAPVYSQANTNATVWFKITAGSNYVDVKDSRTVKINEADMTVDITANERVTYDGQPHVSATINKLIPSGAIISYMWDTTEVGNGQIPSFTDAGTYVINWTAMRSGYKIKTGSYTFIIDKADINSSSYSITANPDVNYDGESHVSATATIPEGMTVTYTCNGKDYNKVPSFTEIGEYKVSYTVSAGSNYNEATGSYTFTIKDGTIEASGEDYTGTYDGNPHSITVKVTKPEGTTISYRTSENGSTDASAWSTEKPTFTNAGTYTVYWKVTKTGYTTVTGHDTVQIDKAEITGYSVTEKPDATYDGTAKVSADVTLPEGATITYTYGEQTSNTIPSFTDVGSYTVSYTISAGDNYNNVTDTYTFVIKKGTLTVTGTNYNAAYDGNAHTITVSVPDGAVISYSETENGAYSATAPTLTNVGSKTVYWKVEKAGYTTVVGSNTITITAKAVTITVDDNEKTLGDKDPAFTGTVTGLVNENDLGTITYTRKAGETVGEYAITAKYTANSNYDVTVVTGTLTIKDPTYVVEITEDYVTGYSLVLVYTNDKATFTYDGNTMYNVTSAGYKYNKADEYSHVYALVVNGTADTDKVAAGTTPVVEILNCSDLDVNKSGSVDLRDAVAVVAVYNANETYMTKYMAIVLEADVNHDKHVSSDDFSLIKAEYLK